VTSVAFLGPVSRVHCETVDGTEVVAQLNSSRAAVFTPGTRVTLGLESDGVLVVPA
jgi:putative spermidine/putrescine transport system ATP-binding protein